MLLKKKALRGKLIAPKSYNGKEKNLQINSPSSHLRKLKKKRKEKEDEFKLNQMEGHNKQKAEINKTENI